MKSLKLILVLSVTCTLASAYVPGHEVMEALTPTQRREFNLYANSRALIEELVESMRKTAKDATDAIKVFSNGVQEEVKDVRNKITEDIERLRAQVSEAIENVSNKFLDSGVSVTECIVIYRDDAYVHFNTTLARSTSCVEDRISDVTGHINSFKNLVNDALEYSNMAIEDMGNCTDSGSFMTIGSCLGTIALQTDMKLLAFTGQVGLMLARMEMYVATLPASLQICVATRIVEAGLHTAKVIMDVGTCSASSIYTIMTSESSDVPSPS